MEPTKGGGPPKTSRGLTHCGSRSWISIVKTPARRGIRAALAAAGTPIGPYDVLIAGQAVARGLTLITHNTREFQRVENLRIEDWEL